MVINFIATYFVESSDIFEPRLFEAERGDSSYLDRLSFVTIVKKLRCCSLLLHSSVEDSFQFLGVSLVLLSVWYALTYFYNGAIVSKFDRHESGM